MRSRLQTQVQPLGASHSQRLCQHCVSSSRGDSAPRSPRSRDAGSSLVLCPVCVPAVGEVSSLVAGVGTGTEFSNGRTRWHVLGGGCFSLFPMCHWQEIQLGRPEGRGPFYLFVLNIQKSIFLVCGWQFAAGCFKPWLHCEQKMLLEAEPPDLCLPDKQTSLKAGPAPTCRRALADACGL